MARNGNEAMFQAMQVAAENPEAISAASQAVRDGSQAANRAGGVKVMAGAAVAGAAVGAVVAGPVIGLVGAGAAAYAATRDDKIGESARAVGNGAIVAGQKAVEFEKEHHVTEKVKAAVSGVIEKAAAIEEEHHVTEKISAIAVGTYAKAKELNEKHHIAERAKDAASGAMTKAAEINEKYQVSSRLTTGLMAGLNKLADAVGSKPAVGDGQPSAPAHPGDGGRPV